MRRTKIVATLGPASSSPDTVRQLIRAGMDVARLNFSHGTHDDHARQIATLRALSQELDTPVTILQDLQGPKIRVGQLPGGAITLVPGAEISLVPDTDVATAVHGVPIDYPHLAETAAPGRTVMTGLLAMSVASGVFAAANQTASPREAAAVMSEPRHSTGGHFHYRLKATPPESATAATDVQLVIDTVWAEKAPQAWAAARDAATGQKLIVSSLGTTVGSDGKTVQSVSVLLPAAYVAEVLRTREFRRLILESGDARDELELPRAYLRDFVREVRAAVKQS